MSYLQALFGAAPETPWRQDVRSLIEPDVLVALVMGIVLSTPLARYAARLRVRSSREEDSRCCGPVRLGWAATSVGFFAAVLFFSGMQLATTTHQPFIYFRF